MDQEKWWHSYVPKTFTCLSDYTWQIFKQDLLAGLTVGVIALPLAMAFAIASGVGPEKGLYTAIVAGFLISLLSGSRVQIGGPAGVFVIVVYGIIQRHGYDGLVVATIMAAFLLIIMGLCRLGNLIRFFPQSLIIGLTAGLGTLVFSLQVKDFLGLPHASVPVHFIEKWTFYFHHFGQTELVSATIGVGTLAIMLSIRRFLPSLPWGIIGLVLATGVTLVFGLNIETIGSRFGEMPNKLPFPTLPNFDLSKLIVLIPEACIIALLAGLESLLSAVVGDNLTGKKHRSNCELLAQGLANIASSFFGGLPATGAIARTTANIHSGAITPIAGMIHAVTLLLLMLLLAPIISKVPMTALAAVLFVVAWNLFELKRVIECLKGSWREYSVMLVTFILIVVHDLVWGIAGGMFIYGCIRAYQKWKAPAEAE